MDTVSDLEYAALGVEGEAARAGCYLIGAVDAQVDARQLRVDADGALIVSLTPATIAALAAAIAAELA